VAADARIHSESACGSSANNYMPALRNPVEDMAGLAPLLFGGAVGDDRGRPARPSMKLTTVSRRKIADAVREMVKDGERRLMFLRLVP
jgi:hypothetical protein